MLVEGPDRWFEQKLRIYPRAHENQLAVQKIRRNRQITTLDLTDLESVFIEAGIGSESDVERARAESGGLGLFVRSLTGLEREAATKAFDKFQEGKTQSSSQLRFVNMVIDYLARNGTVAVEFQYESPFNSLAPRGPEDLFPEEDVDAIVSVIQSVRSTAIPAEHAS